MLNVLYIFNILIVIVERNKKYLININLKIFAFGIKFVLLISITQISIYCYQ